MGLLAYFVSEILAQYLAFSKLWILFLERISEWKMKWSMFFPGETTWDDVNWHLILVVHSEGILEDFTKKILQILYKENSTSQNLSACPNIVRRDWIRLASVNVLIP